MECTVLYPHRAALHTAIYNTENALLWEHANTVQPDQIVHHFWMVTSSPEWSTWCRQNKLIFEECVESNISWWWLQQWWLGWALCFMFLLALSIQSRKDEESLILKLQTKRDNRKAGTREGGKPFPQKTDLQLGTSNVNQPSHSWWGGKGKHIWCATGNCSVRQVKESSCCIHHW